MGSLFKDIVLEFAPLSSGEISELQSYLDLIDDQSERLKLQEMIIKSLRASIYRDNNHEPRLTVLYCMFNLIGLNVRSSNKARDCGELLCKRIMEFYRDNGYKKFNITNRFFMYEIGSIDESIIDGVRAYFCSGFAGENVICNFYRETDFSVLMDRVERMSQLYPKEDRNRLVEYALYYTEDKVSKRSTNEMYINKLNGLVLNGYDFFGITDQILASNKTVNILDLDIYLENLASLRSVYGDYVNRLINNGDMSFNDMRVLVYGFKSDIVLPLDYYLSKPLITREYILWRSENLPIEKYVSIGYCKPSQLGMIRKIILRGFDILKFGINPTMTALTMKRVVERSGISID